MNKSDKYQDIILDILKEVKEDQKSLSQSVVSIDKTLERNTASLEEHMRRTDALEMLHRDNEKRSQNLEAPHKAAKPMKEILISLGKTGAAILAIGSFVSWIAQYI